MERQSLPAQWLHHQTINTEWQSFIVTTMIVLLWISILITLKYNAYITGENTFEPIPRVGGIQPVVAIKERRGFGEQLFVVTLPTISKMVSPYSWGFSIWTVWVFSISLLPVFSNALHLYFTHRLPAWVVWKLKQMVAIPRAISNLTFRVIIAQWWGFSGLYYRSYQCLKNIYSRVQATQIIWPKNCSELEM